MNSTERTEELMRKIQEHEKELRALKEELGKLEGGGTGGNKFEDNVRENKGILEGNGWKWPLEAEEYERYGRQLIIPSVGVKGQLRLKNASVLLIGAGGLGCPAAAYIAGAGVGRIGLVDGDKVEASNLHRQIAHTTPRVGMLKVDSAVAYLKELNPKPQYVPYREHLTPQNAESIIAGYDIVLDCTDHPTSRYLISDVCVLLRKPLVSASAFRTDGQLIVLNAPALERGDPTGGPCYRCVFPKPPPAHTVVSCGEGGILGPVVGTMGVLQALETIRLVAAGILEPLPYEEGGEVEQQQQQESNKPSPQQPTLLLFSATATGPSFRSIRMRSRRPDCFACSSRSLLTLAGLQSGGVDYVRFCGVTPSVSVLGEHERISASEYRRRLAEKGVNVGEDHVLLDVREKEHFGVASIPGAVNIPYSSFASEGILSGVKGAGASVQTAQGNENEEIKNGAGVEEKQEAEKPDWIPDHLPLHAPIYVICRVGNDSQLVTRRLKEMGLDRDGERFIGDIRGGMKAWKEEVDETLPFT